MKLTFAFLAFLLFASCSNNSSPGSNNNGSTSTTFNGAPYLALSDNETFTGHLVGTIKYLDTSGIVTRVDQIDEDAQETVGALQNIRGFLGRALYSYPHGTSKLIGFLGGGSDTSDILAFNQKSNQSIIAFPKNATIGQEWSPGPYPISCQVTLQQHFSSYTASNGKSYSDVVKLSASYLDSSNFYYGFFGSVYKGNAALYFANGIGLVEADIQNYEHLEYYGNPKPYYHQFASGTATRN